jgi:hypothetical protein
MNGTSGFQKMLSYTSPSSTNRLLREQQHLFGTDSWRLLNTHNRITLTTGISTKREKVPDTIFRFICTARVITTVILVVALSGILSACIRVHIALAPNGTAVPRDTPPQDTTPQCDLKSQVPNAQQQTGSWCWAASTQFVMEYLTKTTVSQCTLVDIAFADKLKKAQAGFVDYYDCCNYVDGNPEAAVNRLENTCDQGGWPEWILEKKGIAFQKHDWSMGQGLDWAGLTKQICDDHPFIFVVQWSGGGRHSAVGGGYHTTTEFGNFVEIYEHSPSGFYAMPYQEFLGNRGGFTHEFDYVDIHVP